MPVEFEWSDDNETVTLAAGIGPGVALAVTITAEEMMEQCAHNLRIYAHIGEDRSAADGEPMAEINEDVLDISMGRRTLASLLHSWIDHGNAAFRPGIHAAMGDLLRVIEESRSVEWTVPTYPEVPEEDE